MIHWMDEVQARLGRKNQVLFAKNSLYLKNLSELFRAQGHRVMVLWALDLAAESVEGLSEKYPDGHRPLEAWEAAWAWAAGKIKMRQAQHSILACHALAKEIDCKEDIAACHAIGQACAVVHTAGHAIGYPIYDLTSIVYRHGVERCAAAVEARKQVYKDRLLFWHQHRNEYEGEWAAFLRE